MNQNDSDEEGEDNGNAMEVENVTEDEEVPIQLPEEIHPLALVAINVDIVEEESNDSTNSRAPSPSSVSEEPHTSKKRSHNDSHEDTGKECPICLDSWTTTGKHRLCALKCGHLFGYQCVTTWINSQRKGTCPTCKKRAKRDEIRMIYANKLTAVDTLELENVKKQLEVVTEERNRAQADLARCICRETLLAQEVSSLRSQLNSFNRGAPTVPNTQPPRQEIVRLYMDKSIEVCKYGGSRVFDAKCELDLIAASMKSPTSLFAGFGLKKINISGYRTLSFIPIHTLQIRDICFHGDNNWVLTASMDKTFKVIDNNTNTVIYQSSHQMPLWSCCWDSNNPFVLYVGTQSGSVIKYDVRRITEPLSTLSIEGDMSPVVSVASIPASPGVVLPQGGVVSCKLNSLWVYENCNEEHKRHPISLEGPFVSMKYQPELKQLLVSSRPNNRITYSRHTLSTLEKKEQGIDCNIIHSYKGGGMQKLLSKSCFLSHTSDYVAAHQENCRSVFFWSINTGEKVCSVPAHETVLDLKGLTNHYGDFLVSLTEKKLEFFKFI